MKTRYEIDQSIKIEQTERDTILAIANGSNFAIVLKREDKKFLQKIFRERGEPRVFIYFVFAAMLTILLIEAKITKNIVVDQEYLSHEDLIKLKLKRFLRDQKKEFLFNNISFGLIGKKSPAHSYAAKILSGKIKPQKIVKLQNLLNIINGKS